MHYARRRTSGDHGAAAVEFALLFPIFMVLALGTIASGIAFSKQINITQAAREASRFGATYDIPTIVPVAPATRIDTWLKAVDDALVASAGTENNPIGGYNVRCVAYVLTKPDGSGVDEMRSRHRLNGGATAVKQCPGAPTGSVSNLPRTDYAQVLLGRDTDFFVLFMNPTLQLDAASLTPYEGKAPTP